MSHRAAALATRRLGGVILAVVAATPLPVPAQVSAGATASTPDAGAGLASYVVDADGIALPLGAVTGDAVRGRAIVADRHVGLCLLCHAAPIPEQRFQGNIGPDLAGVGARWSASQLRLRMVDARRLNPDSVMPSYYRVDGLTRVAPALRGKPILSAQQIEDVVAYLATLRVQAATAPASPSPSTFSEATHE